MTALQIKITKNFMNALLASEQFDEFLVEEAVVTTFNTFHIDGHIIRDFFSSEEISELEAKGGLPEFSVWRDIRPICFQLIKGKKIPVSFRVILQAPKPLVTELASNDECEVAADLIRSLVLNIRYDSGRVSCITGSSFNTFIMDKSAERVWDSYVRGLFSKMGLDYEEA